MQIRRINKLHLPFEETKVKTKKFLSIFATLIMIASLLGIFPAAAAPQEASAALPSFRAPNPKFTMPAAFDVSPALRDMKPRPPGNPQPEEIKEIRPDRGPVSPDGGLSGDGALQSNSASLAISAPLANFEGLSNQDNFNVFG